MSRRWQALLPALPQSTSFYPALAGLGAVFPLAADAVMILMLADRLDDARAELVAIDRCERG